MPRLKLSPEAEAWREELDRAFPGKLVLTRTDIGQLFGYGETQTRKWIREAGLPEVTLSLDTARTKRTGFRKRDLAQLLAERTQRCTR